MNLLPAIRYESERRHNQGAAIVSETESTGVRKTWPDYRAVWRWHFYAGVVSIPFIVILAISGSIYLFKPQLEAWLERGYDNLVVKSSALKPASAQISAALKAVPGSSFQSYEIPSRPTDSGRVLLNNQQGEAIRVYVHPESLEVLGSIPERERFMKVLFRIHGELLMGNRGSNLVELASSWAIMMHCFCSSAACPGRSSGATISRRREPSPEPPSFARTGPTERNRNRQARVKITVATVENRLDEGTGTKGRSTSRRLTGWSRLCCP
jgi:hypothetical protein